MKGTAELVFIPSPGQGHLVSTVEIAKQLVGRDHGLSITVLIIKSPFESKVSTHTQSFLSGDFPDHLLKFVDLPQNNSAAELGSKSPATFSLDVIESNKLQVRDVVSEMIASESTRLAGFVIDMFCTPMIDVANEFGLPTYFFFTSSAGFLGLVFHFHTLRQDVDELKDDPDSELSVPASFNQVPAKVLPSVFLDKKGGGQNVFHKIAKGLKESKGIMVNTFAELESYGIKSLSDDCKIPPIYPVGPVLDMKAGAGANTQNQQSEEIMKWLDNQPQSSVVFLCFGSMGSFSEDQVTEIARALEHSGHRFLWSLRRPPPKGKIEAPGEYEEPDQVLPEGFLERTAQFGKVIGWAPQVAVLSHPAVGGFVSHCGWNSILESLWCGVPVATWPLYAEQQMNAFEMVRELGMAVEIKIDYRRDLWFSEINTKEVVTAEEIETGIRKLMDDDNEVREKVKEMSERSRAAVVEGGPSYNTLGIFIEDVMKNMT